DDGADPRRGGGRGLRARASPRRSRAALARMRVVRHVPRLRGPRPPVQGRGRAPGARGGGMNRGDRTLLLLPLALTVVGAVMVYSSSAILGITRYQNPDYFFVRQLFRALLGVLVMLWCARLRLRVLEGLAPWMMAGAAALLAVVVVAGHVSNGATRWLKVGLF